MCTFSRIKYLRISINYYKYTTYIIYEFDNNTYYEPMTENRTRVI